MIVNFATRTRNNYLQWIYSLSCFFYRKLAAAKVNIPWPITTAQKTSSEVQALIQEELPEDSSDEEYNPEHDKQSDDDREGENTASSDIESQLSVSTNNKDMTSSEQQMSSYIQYDSEGIFKIPAYVKNLFLLYCTIMNGEFFCLLIFFVCVQYPIISNY